MFFRVLHKSVADGVAARIGRLAVPQRKLVDTPNYMAISSRGTIPHLTPDVIAKYTNISGAYMALEDFIENSPKRITPAIYKTPQDHGSRPLHAYTATPPSVATILGARRHPAVVSPQGNGHNSVSVFTSTGFKPLEQQDYCDAVATIKPDIVIPLADLTFKPGMPNVKRQLRMAERTEVWMNAFFENLDVDETLKPSGIHVFAPLLPVSYPIQWEYIKRLSEDHADLLSGLAVYDADVLADLGEHVELTSLPRLSLDIPPSPHHVLRQVRQGVDIFTIPFIHGISDAGIALTFSFPPPVMSSDELQPLGADMWSRVHQTSLGPLLEGCDCYSCSKHHRAYLQHLLNAKEMLGWVLLQIHNHRVMDKFFESIRAAIADGSFEEKSKRFSEIYQAGLPLGTGARPRARGYHFKAEVNRPKINPSAWGKFETDQAVDKTLVAEAAGLAVTGPAGEGAETPLVPESNADALQDSGFANVDEKS
ncbi:tRNA-guanine(15) transglycosylase-like protein [Pseudomassariella vexata]|uniref:Queuine tRNA-ribosyltransferase accessory subunit 2 n=1 Tax=Pseudomassariella vexata TaxID=1141098 RepID=A0A1Y2EMN7_9PEZI|nr:tRNA-guanine(15) transglycosylase-like protein [Pseudomassariella vexata]ORY72085.1 tRNA-guanine(15) transglycosylase-like protein [Pseudomassariella vexata]